MGAVSWGDTFYAMIEQRDSAALRRMAGEVRKEETQLLLTLLAEIIDCDQNKSVQLNKAA